MTIYMVLQEKGNFLITKLRCINIIKELIMIKYNTFILNKFLSKFRKKYMQTHFPKTEKYTSS